MRWCLLIGLIVTAVLVLPPSAFGLLTGWETLIAASYSFAASMIVMLFSPILARWVV